MDKIVFRSITPLFEFIQGATEFSHSGTLGDAEYKIYIRKLSPGPENFEVLTKYADSDIKDSLYGIHLGDFHSSTDYFLIIEVFQPNFEKYETSSNTTESVNISSAIINAINLCSTSGVRTEKSYSYRFPKSKHFGGLGIGSKHINDNPFKHHKQKRSQLRIENYNECIRVFDNLLHRNSFSSPFSKILDLSLSYFNTSFKMEFRESSFLTLMLIFEAIFKIDHNDKTENAKNRIAEFLSTTEKEKSTIIDEFGTYSSNGYIGLRNKIVHGDITLDDHILKERYDQLYLRIRSVLIKLIQSDIELKEADDFYSTFIEKNELYT